MTKKRIACLAILSTAAVCAFSALAAKRIPESKALATTSEDSNELKKRTVYLSVDGMC